MGCYHEQDFKSPEEVRKANLVGVDLRGALIDGVDFWRIRTRPAQDFFSRLFRFCSSSCPAFSPI